MTSIGRSEALARQVMERPPHERPGELDRLCGGDAALRREVESQMRALATRAPASTTNPTMTSESAFEPPVKDGTLTHVHDTSQPSSRPSSEKSSGGSAPRFDASYTPGTVIAGRYTLRSVIGEGGMGSVYLAEQSEPVKRQVALKLIRAGSNSRNVLARFGAERQALALMDHPNIARVFDGGTTEQGHPFFVMELVRGVPITHYCDDARLSVKDRLALFIDVCGAVQHAHQKGIIHRDLKPGNVLVTEIDGRAAPKVIDFGVAKAMEEPLTDDSIAEEGLVVGTPAYMSPEQADPGMADIDTRTDVYALGVILYELLVGSPPVAAKDFKQGALLEMLRMIREVEAPRPSTKLGATAEASTIAACRQVDPLRLQHLLKNELDWIVLKSLEKDRTRRYDSASSFARDLLRYLHDEPVEARPPSRGYRLRKFVRRNKAQVTSAVLLVVAMAGGLLGTGYGLIQANRARDAEAEARKRAEDSAALEAIERRRAEDVAGLMESLFRNIDPRAEAELGQSLKEQILAQLDRLALRLESEEGDILVRARLQASLGHTLLSLTEYAQAERMFRSCLELWRDRIDPDDERLSDVELGLAAALQHQGRQDEALELTERARARERRRPADAGLKSLDYDHLVGMIYQGAGRIDEAIEVFESLRDQLQTRGELGTSDGLFVLHTLGAAYREIGRTADAIAIFESVLPQRGALLGDAHPDTLMTANSLAVAYARAGRHADALELSQQTQQRLLQRFAPDHAAVLNSTQNMASSLVRLQRSEEAVALLEPALAAAQAQYGEQHQVTARLGTQLGMAFVGVDRLPEAITTLQSWQPRLAAALGEGHAAVEDARLSLANALRQSGRMDDAVALLEAAIERLEASAGGATPESLRTRTKLAMLQRGSPKQDEGITMLEAVLAQQSSLLGEEHLDTLATMHDLGCLYFSAQRAKDAIAIFERALPLRQKLLGSDHIETLETQGSLGAAYWADRRLDRSIPTLEDTLARKCRSLGIESHSTLGTAEDLIINYGDANRAQDFIEHTSVWLPRLMRARGATNPGLASYARPFLSLCAERECQGKAIEVLDLQQQALMDSLGPDHAETMRVTNNLAASYWAEGRLDHSIAIYEDLVRRSRAALGESSPDTLLRAGSLVRNYLDAGRYDEALALADETLRLAGAVAGLPPARIESIERDRCLVLAKMGRKAEAVAAVEAFVAKVRSQGATTGPGFGTALGVAGLALLEAGAYEQAEPVLRECVAVREAADPKAWQTHNARSLLGGALSGLGRLDEAEPLLVAGHEGLQALAASTSIPRAARPRVREAAARLAAHYRARHAQDPTGGFDARARAIEAIESPPGTEGSPR